MEVSLPLGLRQALESGDCVLFVGAGVGGYLHAQDGTLAPTGPELATELATRFLPDYPDLDDLSTAAQLVEIRKGRAELEAFLKRRLSSLDPADPLRFLATLRWRSIFTTNYDNGLERSYELIPQPPQNPVPISATGDLRGFDPLSEVPIYHIHGALFGAEDSRVLITQDDYALFRDRRRMLFETLKLEAARSTFLYIGYSNRDPNWRQLLEELRAEFFPADLPRSFRIAPSTPLAENEILRSKGIETLEIRLEEFKAAVEIEVQQLSFEDSSVARLADQVPPSLAEQFKKSPAAVARLLSSWTYVNEAPFRERPNIRMFLRGERPNWALVASGEYFERDVEDEIYDDLLDFATGSTRRPANVLLLAPAGYGTTTLLMAVAARLVGERAGPCFWHKPGTALREGDVEFAASLFPESRPFFFVDNAADASRTIQTLFQRFKELHLPTLFVLGERLNEWRSSPFRVRGREHVIEPLSEPEIKRLVAYLDEHGELGVLADLSEELKLAAIRNKHEKELLVALREATEGKGFDAILEDEYRSIPNDFSKRAYLIVSCFYQHRGLLRDTLLAGLMGVDLVEFHEQTRNSTEGLITYEPIDVKRGYHGARTRHPTIASVVWDRCGSQAECEEILIAALRGLNFAYRTDRTAFDSFVRSDRLVDSIATLDGRTRYFETACQKDPENPYVRQHFARMLLRADKPELSLSQIEKGIDLSPNATVLRHTKGHVLAKLATTAASDEIARRRLAQAEDEFRRCLAARPRDEYAYQSMARLYLGWAGRCTSSDEAAEYVARAEATVDDGLRQVNVKEGLWIVSSEIESFVGDRPGQIQALEKAVAASDSGVIARFLLARAKRRARQPRAALEVLEPVIRAQADEFRCVAEYALALLDDGKSYDEALAVMRLGTRVGLGDPRFVAIYGGLLFLTQNFSDADAAFQESIRREFPADEARRIRFRPCESGKPGSRFALNGRVASARAGYALLDVPGYPQILLPGSKFGQLLIRKGFDLDFEIGFSARRPIAERPRLAP